MDLGFDDVGSQCHSQGWTDQKKALTTSPQPRLRTGPVQALDGQPKFDLNRLDPANFERLREHVSAAGRRGIYVFVKLFEGWGLMHGNRHPPGWAWQSHPFHPRNNVNGVNADGDGDDLTGEVHRLGDDAVNGIQAACLRKMVDTVNDLVGARWGMVLLRAEPRCDSRLHQAIVRLHRVGIRRVRDREMPGQIELVGRDAGPQ